MGILSNNYAQIIPGALISASYVSDIYDVLMGTEPESIILSGSLTITGSVLSTTGFTGSLFGTSSWAITSSYAKVATTASYAINYINSSSIADSAISASYIELAQSASYINLAQSASYVESASYALTASYIELAQSASYVTTASYALTALSASYAPSLATAVLHTHYAFIDLVTGNDTTAALGDVTKPYATIASAQTALIAFGVSESQPGCIYLRSGTYGSTITLKTNIITYCESGVVFTAGGFIDDINTVKAIVLGHGQFIQNATLYTGAFATEVYIEAHSLIKTAGYSNRGISVIPIGWSNITVVLDKCILGTTAYDMILRGLTNFNFTCKTQVECTYNICTVNYNADQYAIGKFVLTAPSWLFKTAGSSYVKYAIRLQGTATGFEWIMNGDIIFEAANSTSLLVWALLGYNDTLTFNGNINLGAANGGQALNSSNTKVIFNSPTFKGTTFLMNVNQSLEVLFNKCRIIKQIGTATPAFQVAGTSKLNMIGCQFIHLDTGSIDMINITSNTVEVNMLRTDAQASGSANYLINSNATTAVLGIKNCISNINISNVVLHKYATNNLEVESLLTLPNF